MTQPGIWARSIEYLSYNAGLKLKTLQRMHDLIGALATQTFYSFWKKPFLHPKRQTFHYLLSLPSSLKV